MERLRSVASAVEQVERLRRVAGGSASAPAMVERLACSNSERLAGWLPLALVGWHAVPARQVDPLAAVAVAVAVALLSHRARHNRRCTGLTAWSASVVAVACLVVATGSVGAWLAAIGWAYSLRLFIAVISLLFIW